MPNYRLDIAYDGTEFHGYARQPGMRTVQGELEAALAIAAAVDETHVAGRTDAGVHASGQVVSFKGGELSCGQLTRSLNKILPTDLAVLRCEPVSDEFHARFSARSRTYRYTVLGRPTPEPLLRRTTWHVPDPLDLDAMQAAAGHFLGEHDFASLCRQRKDASTVREVTEATWQREGDLLMFDVTATSFCHQLVRSMVALSVDVGRGRVAASSVPDILEARDRNAGRGAAPPHGLELRHVEY